MLETQKRCSLRVLDQLLEVSHTLRGTLDEREGPESEQALLHQGRSLNTLLEQDTQRFVHQTLEVHITSK